MRLISVLLRLGLYWVFFKGTATSLPIFCVGSRDYLGCLRLQTNLPAVFLQESEVTSVLWYRRLL